MVKGISRQVILVQAPDPKLFDQAIFILKENALGEGVTDEQLLKEARAVIRGSGGTGKKRRIYMYRSFWAGTGALGMGLAWLITLLL